MINADNIKKNLEELSFPRLSGTNDEKKAFILLKGKIEELNINPTIQNFTFSTFYSRIYPKIAFSLGFWLLLILFLNPNRIFIQVNVLVISIIFILLFIITKKPEKIKVGKILHSKNLLVEFSLKPLNVNSESEVKQQNSNNNLKNILLFSHVDSKGQRLPIKIRIFSFKLWLLSYPLGILIIIFKYTSIGQLYLWIYICGVIVLFFNFLATILIVINTTNNNSPGAIDNASGAVCVLELLKFYANPVNRLRNFNLWFVFTGAEECGTMGIRHFCNKINNINKKQSYIINIDSIGKDAEYFSSSINSNNNIELWEIFNKIAKKLNFRFHHTNVSFGVRSDGLYLKSQGFQGFGFADINAYKYVHSIKDTADNVDAHLLKELCIYITKILQEIDNRNYLLNTS